MAIWCAPVVLLLGGGVSLLLYYLLSPVYRGVGREFYCGTPQRRAIITGASSGIGRHLTGALLRLGLRVVATDVDYPGLERASVEDGWAAHSLVRLQRLDVTKRSEWDTALKVCCDKMGGVDVCLNVAGYLMPRKIQHVTQREIDVTIDVNVKGVIMGTHCAAKVMIEQKGGGGHVVNVSSMAALCPVSGVTLYACSKYAVRGFSFAAAKDLAAHGVAVTCLMPDAVQTPMVDLQLKYEDSALAFSGAILTTEDVERCVVDRILPHRPVECWLSPRGGVARFGDLFHASRAIHFAETFMRWKGLREQARRNAAAAAAPSSPTSPPRPQHSVWRSAGLVVLLAWIIASCCSHGSHPQAAEIAREFSEQASGRVFVVTGASGGIGLETARVIAEQGGIVVAGSRDSERARRAIAGTGIQFLPLDLASSASIEQFVEAFHALNLPPLYCVVANAGVISKDYGETADGIEQTFGINHLGHFQLLQLLRSDLEEQPRHDVGGDRLNRVVIVSSYHGHALFTGRLDLSALPRTRETFGMFKSYGESKLANIMHSKEIARWFKNVLSFSVHPGMIGTSLGTTRGDSLRAQAERLGSRLFWALMSPFTKTIEQGAATQVFAALAPSAEMQNGGYYDSLQLREPAAAALDDRAASELWEFSERLLRDPRS